MTIDPSKLPTRTLTAGTKLYRIHRQPPWYFDGGDGGRFNPAQKPGRGACYWGEEPLAAWVESFRTQAALAQDDVDRRVLSEITLRKPLRVVDLANRKGPRAGVTNALTHGPYYAPAQQLASELDGVVDGVRWVCRNDLGAKLITVALFGEAGAAAGRYLGSLPTPAMRDIASDLIEEAEREFGYSVLPTPP